MSEAPRRGAWETAGKMQPGGNAGNMNIFTPGNDGQGLTDPSAPVLMQPEAERLIETLQPMSLREVGTEKWMKQHEVIEKLNLQAHQSARTNSEDFVLEALITFEKLPVLVHELIVIETWREFVYPKIYKDLAKSHSMRAYFVLYHEATLANLLEVLLYYDYSVEAMEDSIIELVDWTIRRLVYLNALPDDHAEKWARLPKERPQLTGDVEKDKEIKMKAAKAAAAELNNKTPEDDLYCHYLTIQFRSCCSAATIARYLTQHTEKLSLNVLSRMLDTHDILMLLCPLVETPPWTWRNRDTAQWMKFENQKWKVVKPINLLKLTKLEGQIWLAIYNILTDKACGERYYFSSQRKDNLLRARKYLNDVLLDQLPMLADIQRFMDEITIMKPPEASAKNMGGLIMEQVPVVRDGMVQRCNWVEEASFSLQEIFGKTDDRSDKGLQALADLYSGDALESLVAEQEITPEERRGSLISGQIKLYAPRREYEDPISKFNLKVVAGKPTPQSTSQGMFERYRLEVVGTTLGAFVPYLGTMKVILTFQDGTTMDVETELPMEIPSTVVEKYDSYKPTEIIDVVVPEDAKKLPGKAWQKIGSVDERAIIQVQLVRAKHGRKENVTVVDDGTVHLHCYNLGIIFVSVPMIGKRAREQLEQQLQSANEARLMKEEMAENTEKAIKKKTKKRREDDNTVEKFRDRMKKNKDNNTSNNENDSNNNKITMVDEKKDSPTKTTTATTTTSTEENVEVEEQTTMSKSMDEMIEETEFDELD